LQKHEAEKDRHKNTSRDKKDLLVHEFIVFLRAVNGSEIKIGIINGVLEVRD